MSEVKFSLNDKGHGAFYVMNGEERIGEMDISINEKKLTVYHTEVAPEAEGQGLAKQMLQTMVDHARKNKLQVIPLCPYVHAQFKRHPADYADIWDPEAQDE